MNRNPTRSQNLARRLRVRARQFDSLQQDHSRTPAMTNVRCSHESSLATQRYSVDTTTLGSQLGWTRTPVDSSLMRGMAIGRWQDTSANGDSFSAKESCSETRPRLGGHRCRRGRLWNPPTKSFDRMDRYEVGLLDVATAGKRVIRDHTRLLTQSIDSTFFRDNDSMPQAFSDRQVVS